MQINLLTDCSNTLNEFFFLLAIKTSSTKHSFNYQSDRHVINGFLITPLFLPQRNKITYTNSFKKNLNGKNQNENKETISRILEPYIFEASHKRL